jgi:hypothetical protein
LAELFDTWCDTSEETDGRKTLWRATEEDNGRAVVLDEIAERARSHYVSDDEIATFLEVLGYDDAADVIRENYPEGATARSADLGEILCAEIVEEWCDHNVPIRKLRYKDHREQALRGEDVIGVRLTEENQLSILKGEAKSAQALSTDTVTSAREGLEANSGRPTAHAMIYLARKLLNSGSLDDQSLGELILKESKRAEVPKDRIAHCLFVLSGNPANDMLDDDFEAADGGRDQFIIQIQIPDHAALVEAVYEKVIDLEVD